MRPDQTGYQPQSPQQTYAPYGQAQAAPPRSLVNQFLDGMKSVLACGHPGPPQAYSAPGPHNPGGQPAGYNVYNHPLPPAPPQHGRPVQGGGLFSAFTAIPAVQALMNPMAGLMEQPQPQPGVEWIGVIDHQLQTSPQGPASVIVENSERLLFAPPQIGHAQIWNRLVFAANALPPVNHNAAKPLPPADRHASAAVLPVNRDSAIASLWKHLAIAFQSGACNDALGVLDQMTKHQPPEQRLGSFQVQAAAIPVLRPELKATAISGALEDAETLGIYLKHQKDALNNRTVSNNDVTAEQAEHEVAQTNFNVLVNELVRQLGDLPLGAGQPHERSDAWGRGLKAVASLPGHFNTTAVHGLAKTLHLAAEGADYPQRLDDLCALIQEWPSNFRVAILDKMTWLARDLPGQARVIALPRLAGLVSGLEQSPERVRAMTQLVDSSKYLPVDDQVSLFNHFVNVASSEQDPKHRSEILVALLQRTAGTLPAVAAARPSIERAMALVNELPVDGKFKVLRAFEQAGPMVQPAYIGAYQDALQQIAAMIQAGSSPPNLI